MTDAALECLKQDDLRMFYKGACHVFAVALQRYRSLEQYELCRVLCRGLGAYHVYARTGDWLVDVGGLKREADYFHWLQRRANEHEWTSAIRYEAVSETELLRQARIDEARGTVNEWGLFTDPDFVSQAMARAQKLVEESDRYSAILMR
jgi:hypothetical protein